MGAFTKVHVNVHVYVGKSLQKSKGVTENRAQSEHHNIQTKCDIPKYKLDPRRAHLEGVARDAVFLARIPPYAKFMSEGSVNCGKDGHGKRKATAGATCPRDFAIFTSTSNNQVHFH